MKFRARFASPAQLSKLVQTLSKIADSCVVHLTSDAISFAIVGDAGEGIQVWADISRASLFCEHRIESKNSNQISFTSTVGNLHRALRSACADSNVQTVVKLTKKSGIPTFTFEIVQAQTQLKITHDVPIRLIHDVEELTRYYEPSIPDEFLSAAGSVVLPAGELKGLRNTVERMRSFSQHLVLCAANGPDENTLSLTVHSESLVCITTVYSKLATASQASDGQRRTAEAKVRPPPRAAPRRADGAPAPRPRAPAGGAPCRPLRVPRAHRAACGGGAAREAVRRMAAAGERSAPRSLTGRVAPSRAPHAARRAAPRAARRWRRRSSQRCCRACSRRTCA